MRAHAIFSPPLTVSFVISLDVLTRLHTFQDAHLAWVGDKKKQNGVSVVELSRGIWGESKMIYAFVVNETFLMLSRLA